MTGEAPMTAEDARRVLAAALGRVLRAQGYDGLMLSALQAVKLGAACVWVARATEEGDTIPRRVAEVLRRWGVA